MSRIKLTALFFLIFFQVTFSAVPELQIGIVKDFVLESGTVIKECKVTYRTFGTLNVNKDNVILYPTWFAGNSAHLAGLIGEGKIVDSAKYFVIAVDALGDGYATSPSNWQVSENPFPQISIRDMVNSQYRMLTECLGLKQLFAVVGGSMGSMQVFEWVVSYPEFMKKAVPYVCTPKLTSFDLLWMNWADDLIKEGKQCGRTDKEIWKNLNTITAMLGRTPDHIVQSVKTDTFMNYYRSFYKDPSATFTLANYEAQLHAMMQHDVFRYENGSVKNTAARIKAKMLFIYSDEDHLIRSETAEELQKELGCQQLVLNNQMGHMSVGKELSRVSKVIAEFLGN